MAKVGRPKTDNPRHNRYSVRLTDAENDALQRYCEEHKVAAADVFRRSAVSYLSGINKKGE